MSEKKDKPLEGDDRKLVLVVRALQLMAYEYSKAKREQSPAFGTLEDGLAALEESLENLKAEVWQFPPYDREAVGMAALRVGTMAVRFVVDLCDDPDVEIY